MRKIAALIVCSGYSTGASAVPMEQDHLIWSTYGESEFVQQTGNNPAQLPLRRNDARLKIGIGYDHLVKYPGRSLSDMMKLEEERSFLGRQSSVLATANVNHLWDRERFRAEVGLGGSYGQFNLDSVPLSAVLDPNLPPGPSSYYRGAINGSMAYALSRDIEIKSFGELARAETFVDKVITANIRNELSMIHSRVTKSTLGCGLERDIQTKRDNISISHIGYRLEHSLTEKDKAEGSVAENFISSSARMESAITGGFSYSHREQDQLFQISLGRNLGRRIVTNEQNISDVTYGSYSVISRPSRQRVEITMSHNSENDIFRQSNLTPQTIDSAKLEYALGVNNHPRRGNPFDDDNVRLSIQSDHVYDRLLSYYRRLISVGYYTSF